MLAFVLLFLPEALQLTLSVKTLYFSDSKTGIHMSYQPYLDFHRWEDKRSYQRKHMFECETIPFPGFKGIVWKTLK